MLRKELDGPAPDWSRAITASVPQRSWHRPTLWLTAAALVIFLVWAKNAPLDQTTRGVGKIAPLSGGQIIQSFEGGILSSLAVQEGEEVVAGQTLAVLDDTRFRSAFQDLEGQTIALRAALNRLQAELANATAVEFDPDVAQAAEIVSVERQLFEARRRKLKETTFSLRERLTLAERELAMVRPMVERGAVSAVEQLRLERNAADLRGGIEEAQNTYLQDVNDQIASKSAELSSLDQQLAQKRDALRRTVLKSPVRGIVKNLQVTTRGGVIQPGETIMEIVPLGDQLYVEAEIRPQDIAFLYPGLPATVKITAYDYTIYGSLSGRLVFISADTIHDERRRDSEPYYRVRVLTDSAALAGPEGPLAIKPGMVAEVAIQTGKKTVLEYLLKPILRGQEAFSER